MKFKQFIYLGAYWIVATVSLVSEKGYANPEINVNLASKSPIKMEAVKKAFRYVYPGLKISLSTFSSASQIADQPVGARMGLLGAQNRLQNAQSTTLPPSNDTYWVSIENYIECASSQPHQWIDRAVLILQKGRTRVTEYSEPVKFDSSFALEAQKQTSGDYLYSSSGYSMTVGKLIQEVFFKRNELVSHDNWQANAAFGGTSRTKLIQDALIRAIIKAEIQEVADFPKKGILFRDFSPLLAKPDVFKATIRLMAQRYENLGIDAVAGLDARGFILGVPLALKLNKPFLPVRKKGKLPVPTHSQTYITEYSEDQIEISAQGLEGKTILLVDDLLATGGTLEAAENLFKAAGVSRIYSTTLMELSELQGRKKLTSEFFTLFSY